MLTEREEKLIKRYCIYPKLAMTGVIMALALGVPYVLLEMIDDIVFHDDRAVFWGLCCSAGVRWPPASGCAGRNGGNCSAGPMSGKAKPIIPGRSQALWA